MKFYARIICILGLTFVIRSNSAGIEFPRIRRKQGKKNNLFKWRIWKLKQDVKNKIRLWLWKEQLFLAKGKVKDTVIEKTSSTCEFDCKASGHICCQLSEGIQECRKDKNCPKDKIVQGMYQNYWNGTTLLYFDS